MSAYPETTLRSGRHVIANAIQEIQHLSKSDSPLAWDQARIYAGEILEACKVVHLELAHYVRQEPELLNAEEDAALDEMEARQVDAAHPAVLAPIFETLTQQFKTGA